MDFQVGDMVYASDWCYGEIIRIEDNIADIEFETAGGGGTISFELSELKHECSGCIYDLTDRIVTDVETFNTILDNCCACKRCKLKEYKDDFADLYKSK
jgi:hypothetical protein